jgi:hypothetical protein
LFLREQPGRFQLEFDGPAITHRLKPNPHTQNSIYKIGETGGSRPFESGEYLSGATRVEHRMFADDGVCARL